MKYLPDNIVTDYVVIDLETTGLNPKVDKIIEIGAAKIRNGNVVETFDTYINPGMSLSEKVSELTGIKDEDLLNAPLIGEVLEKIMDFTEGEILLGHNLIFDYSFLKKAAVNHKLQYERKGIDTLRIARRFVTESESKRLGDLCSLYNIELKAHRALNDALATHELYQILMAKYSQNENDLFKAIPLFYSVKKESPITPRQKTFLMSICEQAKVPIENNIIILSELNPSLKGTPDRINIERMTKNEASRLIDYLRSYFALGY